MSLTSTQSHLTASLLTSILAVVLGSLQIGYHTGNVNAPAKVSQTDGSWGEKMWHYVGGYRLLQSLVLQFLISFSVSSNFITGILFVYILCIKIHPELRISVWKKYKYKKIIFKKSICILQEFAESHKVFKRSQRNIPSAKMKFRTATKNYHHVDSGQHSPGWHLHKTKYHTERDAEIQSDRQTNISQP